MELRNLEFRGALPPAGVWTIVEQCVLAAGAALNGYTPNAWSPLNRWILTADGLVDYYGKLQNLLAARGIRADLDPFPIAWQDVDKNDFLGMIQAVDKQIIGG